MSCFLIMTNKSWIFNSHHRNYILESYRLVSKALIEILWSSSLISLCVKYSSYRNSFRRTIRYFEGEVNNLISAFTMFNSSNLLSWKLLHDKIPSFSKYYICPSRFWWKAHSHSYVNILQNHLFAIVSNYHITLKLRLCIIHMEAFLRITHSPLGKCFATLIDNSKWYC